MKRRELFIRGGGLLLGAAAVPLVAESSVHATSHPLAIMPTHGQTIAGPIYYAHEGMTNYVRDEIVYAHVFNPATVFVLTDEGWKEVEL